MTFIYAVAADKFKLRVLQLMQRFEAVNRGGYD